MENLKQQKRPVSLTIICILCLTVTTLTILLYIRQYHFYTSGYKDNNPNVNHYSPGVKLLRSKWDLAMIFLQLPVIAGVVLMYFLKRTGLWVFGLGKLIFFGLPFMAGTGEDVLGLMTPVFS